MSIPYFSLDNISASFRQADGREQKLDGIGLTQRQGEFVTLLGPPGCGKSMILRIIAGLTKPHSGGAFVEDRLLTKPAPDRALVSEKVPLLPWRSVYGNIELAVKQVFKLQPWGAHILSEDERRKQAYGVKKSARSRREWIDRYLQITQLDGLEKKRPHRLTAEQKLRVALARALATQPKLLLLDEPFAALDAVTRGHLQDNLADIHVRLRNTVLLATHDVDEALLLSDRIVLLTGGPVTSVARILEPDLPRQRDRIALAQNPAYNRYRQDLLEFLYEQRSGEETAATAAGVSPASKASPAENAGNQPSADEKDAAKTSETPHPHLRLVTDNDASSEAA